MGSIGGLLGFSGGAAGTGFSAPQGAAITDPTSSQQLGTAYNGSQNALSQQQSLLNAIQGQNGLANQSQVYNQLQGVVNGTGPNPAQAQLAQSTGQNVANQAALMAGQRGTSANTGLLARQAAQQGASTQQQAAGQAATLQAQQSLNALGQVGSLANQQAANQIGATENLSQAQQNEQAQLLQAQQGYNTNAVQMQSNINSVNAGLAQQQMQGQQSIVGGVGNAIAGLTHLAKGGEVSSYAYGGPASVSSYADGGITAPTAIQPASTAGPQSSFGSFLSGYKNGVQSAPQYTDTPIMRGIGSGMKLTSPQEKKPNTPTPATTFQGQQLGPSTTTGAELQDPSVMQAARGGKVPALVSPGEVYLSPDKAKAVAQGKADPIKDGEKIPGKPKVGGAKDSYANDTVPKTLEEGGIVLPRHVTQSKDPAAAAHKFVSAIMARHNMSNKGK